MNFIPNKIDPTIDKILNGLLKLPDELRINISYCQKNIQTFLKVYEMIDAKLSSELENVVTLKKKYDASQMVKYQKQLDEILYVICDIDDEQKTLIQQFKDLVDEFYIQFIKKYPLLQIDRKIFDNFIAKQLQNLINMPSFHLKPSNMMKPRLTEQQLIARYNLNDDKVFLELNDPKVPSTVKLSLHDPSTWLSNQTDTNEGDNSNDNDDISKENKVSDNNMKINEKDENESKSVEEKELNIKEREDLISILKPKIEDKKSNKNQKNIKGRVIIHTPPTVTSSRISLLQALSKAKNQINGVTLPSVQQLQQNFTEIVEKPQVKASSSKTSKKCSPPSSRNSIDSNNSIKSSTTNDGVSTSTQNSRETSPFIEETIDSIDTIENLGQEMYLRLFGLYTLEHSKNLIEKRSKRKRRNVQSNAKSDYHYGHLDATEKFDKKKKIYLASPPQIKNKRRKVETPSELIEVKMTTSVQKPQIINDKTNKISLDYIKMVSICNECQKIADLNLPQCDICGKQFHIGCHSVIFSKQPLAVKQRICPPCQRNSFDFITNYRLIPSGTYSSTQKFRLREEYQKMLRNHDTKTSLESKQELLKYCFHQAKNIIKNKK